MYKFKIFLSISIFSILLIGTSIIKNQTREIEKKILKINKVLIYKERDFGESKLDFYYLTSPSFIESKVKLLDSDEYIPMEYSNIFFSLKDFIKLHDQIAIQNNLNEKKLKKNKKHNINQASFYFEDYLETSKVNKNSIKKNIFTR